MLKRKDGMPSFNYVNDSMKSFGDFKRAFSLLDDEATQLARCQGNNRIHFVGWSFYYTCAYVI
jgi:hypothetical protein